MGIEEKIKEIEKEISRTQKNKATENHLGMLRSKLVRLQKMLAQEKAKAPVINEEPKVEEEDKLKDIQINISGVKNRFSSLDILAIIHDLKTLKGMRVINVYDIDSKTYLIKLHKPDGKAVILFESGIRIHKTQYDWPKQMFPSSFSMKFRKHIRQKRLEDVRQIGLDRVVDLRFGDEDRACHVIIELYDRGNVLLTDHNYTILNILRPRTDKDQDVRYAVRERYPLELAQYKKKIPNTVDMIEALMKAKKGSQTKRIISPLTNFGPALIEHALILQGFPPNSQIGVHLEANENDATKIYRAILYALDEFDKIKDSPSKGYITYQNIKKIDGSDMEKFIEYHPMKFSQFTGENSKVLVKEYNEFSEAVDEFYSKLDSQKSEKRALQIEKDALKKVENVKKDHEERLKNLVISQASKKEKAERIEINVELIDQALLVIQSAIANQMSWEDIEEMTKQGQEQGNEIAKSIVGFDLKNNKIIMRLPDNFDPDNQPMNIAIDINLTANQNAREYYTDKKLAAVKETKTLQASEKAIKSAHVKAQQTLNQVKANVEVLRSKKSYWFEKFYWFISSENYLIIGGRDAQQNELIVKKYFRPSDIYVHADLHGASSVVIRNPYHGKDIPPKTLNEAGTMAICYSAAWEAKVVSNAWWVRHDQVSRTAPTGEYLPTGSFMIRGKKNYLPTSQLVMGFGVIFRIDDDSIERHKDDRKNNLLEIEEEYVDNDEEFPDVKVNINLNEKKTDDEYVVIQLGPTNLSKKKELSEREKYLKDKKKKEQEILKAKKEKKKEHGVKGKKKNKKGNKKEDEEWDKLEKKATDIIKEVIAFQSHPESDKEDEDDGSDYSEEIVTVDEIKNLKIKDNENDNDKEQNKKESKGRHEEPEEVSDDEDDEKKDDDLSIINMLVGNPLPEDELLGSLIVVAPYQTLQNYKYRVKLTPGTGKRGKAAKQAVDLFLKEKNSSAAEKKLIKVLQTNEEVARNIPGKVKVSAPQLFANKKSK
ncbi:Nuclear export mediator factor NEMF [Strongyloides ratti]|uniref:Nuclear export mediator factor NEMF n=1 Tax=Strongyloides ratti TaxID=34506 RepID=A0A090KXK4_STRRB|nr:Nuclear export mediator factor NEMF [Strongyloides ratti]CEF62205.1 Nuclear export mediator factor NEMF [Strongyloides ratti]